jgi:hypothetical protein
MLENKKWDYIILQNYNSKLITDPNKFEEHGEKFIH